MRTSRPASCLNQNNIIMKKLTYLTYSKNSSFLWVNLSLVGIILLLTHQACNSTINLRCLLGLDRLSVAKPVLIDYTVAEAPWNDWVV